MRGRASTELLRPCTVAAAVTAAARPHAESVFPELLPFHGSLTLKEIRDNWIFFVVIFLFQLGKQWEKKDNHHVCMTQKHQLKTNPCITYYFMLGWNLSACINSLYKLRLAGSGRRCVGRGGFGVVVFVDGLVSGSEVTAVPCIVVPQGKMKTKKRRRLICVLQSFRGGGGGLLGGARRGRVVWGVISIINYSNQAVPSLRRRGRKGLNTCIGKEMGCFKK